jgi:hypothetical protein
LKSVRQYPALLEKGEGHIMKTSKLCLQLGAIVVLLVLLSGLPTARALGGPQAQTIGAAAIGTAITYQGQLKDGSGNPVTATCEFNFSLWDSLSGGSQAAGTSTLDKPAVAVTDGYFTVQLDFGNNGFNGLPRFLQISVKCGGETSFTSLNPRQPLTPAPYALYAAAAGNAGNAASVTNGLYSTGSYANPAWLTSLAGSKISGAVASATNADTVDGLHASAFEKHYAYVVTVAKSGGDFSSISAAVNAIIDASAASPYLVYVAPGVYNEQVTMKPYVDIEGSGELSTKITYGGSSSITTGTVIGADNAELRFISVENTGGNTNAVALYNDNASPHFSHLTATVAGATTSNYGIFNTNNSSPTMSNLTILAKGTSGDNCAVRNNYSNPTMTEISASASGGVNGIGVKNYYSAPLMMDVIANASGGIMNTGVDNYHATPIMNGGSYTATGGQNSYGMKNESFSDAVMQNVVVSAKDGTSANTGILNSESSPVIKGVSVSSSGGTSTTGVFNYLGSSPTMTDVSASAADGTNNYGVFNENTDTNPTLTNVTATATGGTKTYGVWNDQGASPSFTGLTATASGASSGNYGMWNDSVSVTIQNSGLSASSGSPMDGMHNVATTAGSYTVKISNSVVSGATSTIYSVSGFTVDIGDTQLIGSGVQGSGVTYLCVGAYTGAFTGLDSTCH